MCTRIHLRLALFHPPRLVRVDTVLWPSIRTGARGGTLDSSSSVAIWQPILAAAVVDHFQPFNGSLEQTRVINARYFT